MRLKEIIEKVKNYKGIVRKRPIKEIFEILKVTHNYGNVVENFGDDAAAIPFGDGYLLVAADGIMTSLLFNEPYAAGKSAVMVSVNDIYSMGGRPIGLVNVLASGDEKQRMEIIKGIRKGCDKFKIPMLGGHTHPDAPYENPSLSIAIFGFAKKLIQGHLAKRDDLLVIALDLNGRRGCKSVLSWDANSGKSSDEIINRLEVLPTIAERELVNAGKDVSNGGIIGTLSILVENSNKGAIIDLSLIPKPDSIDLLEWLLCFHSYGFVFSLSSEFVEEVISLFQAQNITAKVIGKVIEDRKVILEYKGQREVLFDFEKEIITGITAK